MRGKYFNQVTKKYRNQIDLFSFELKFFEIKDLLKNFYSHRKAKKNGDRCMGADKVNVNHIGFLKQRCCLVADNYSQSR